MDKNMVSKLGGGYKIKFTGTKISFCPKLFFYTFFLMKKQNKKKNKKREEIKIAFVFVLCDCQCRRKTISFNIYFISEIFI